MTREEAIQLFKEMESKEMYWQLQELCDLAIEALSAECEHCIWNDCNYNRIDPDVDIVRCKDCKYFKKITEKSDSGLCHRDIVASVWEEDGFCSRAERREP